MILEHQRKIVSSIDLLGVSTSQKEKPLGSCFRKNALLANDDEFSNVLDLKMKITKSIFKFQYYCRATVSNPQG